MNLIQWGENDLARENDKFQVIDYGSSIKKSNELSMAKLNQGLTLNQMQLLAYAIYSTQQDGKTEFIKADFERKFGMEKYQTRHAKEDAQRLLDLKFSIEDLENDFFEYRNVFSSIRYKKGTFNFKWNEEFIPHILELKEKYVITDLTITSQFKSEFSWILYEYLKANYGYWYKELSKEALMKLFAVEDRKTYIRNTSRFKTTVLDVAIQELNEYTEFKVWYTETRKGRAIVGFKLHWSTGKREISATDKQISLLREVHDEVERRMFDYLALENSKNRDIARTHIIRIKEINQQINEELTLEQADKFIQEVKQLYGQLQTLLAKDGKERDTSIYYNWLEEC